MMLVSSEFLVRILASVQLLNYKSLSCLAEVRVLEVTGNKQKWLPQADTGGGKTCFMTGN